VTTKRQAVREYRHNIFFKLYYCCRKYGVGLYSTTLTQWALKVTRFGEMTQNNGQYAVQGHSRSPILVPIESS